MPTLSELEADAHLIVPRDLGSQIKMLARDERYRIFWKWFIDDARRLSFVPGRDDPTEFMIWREGRRFKPEMALRVIEEPITDPEPELPARRTARPSRRATKNPEG